MDDSDLEPVAAIEQQDVSAWSKQAISEELKRSDVIALVLCNDGDVAGWVCCRHYSGEAELLKIGITQKCRRRGFGSMLLDNLLSILRSKRVIELFLEVRSVNQTAQSFYHCHGFTDAGRRINYYRHPPDDALIMKKTIQLEARTDT